MFNFKTLRCSHCGCVLLNLPGLEVQKLEGLRLVCETCGRPNRLENDRLTLGAASEALGISGGNEPDPAFGIF